MNWRAEDALLEPLSTDEDSFERGLALDELNIQVKSRNFRGGRLTAVMSGVTVDLREAALCADGATIDVQSALSDIDILVPHDWDVTCDVDAAFGMIARERFAGSPSERGPRLRVTGMLVAGDLRLR